MKLVNICVVDDHKIIRDGIKAFSYGSEVFNVIGEACCEKELMPLLEKINPDILVLDVTMPGKSGINIIEIIKSKYPTVKILMLSANDNRDTIFDSIEAGADGFLHKDSSEEEFIRAIKTINNGEAFFSENIIKLLKNRFVNMIRNESSEQNNINDLTEREKELIIHLSNGLLQKEIADIMDISQRTVETHKKNLQKKLGISSTVDIVKFAIKNNLIEI